MRFDLTPDGDDATVLHFTLHWPVPPGADSPFAPEHLSGFHGMLDNLRGHLEGTWTSESMDALIAQHPSDIGRIGVQMAVDYLKSQEEPSKKQVKTGLSIVTRDNLQEPEIEKYLYKAEC